MLNSFTEMIDAIKEAENDAWNLWRDNVFILPEHISQLLEIEERVDAFCDAHNEHAYLWTPDQLDYEQACLGSFKAAVVLIRQRLLNQAELFDIFGRVINKD